jgi:hypothetical protein
MDKSSCFWEADSFALCNKHKKPNVLKSKAQRIFLYRRKNMRKLNGLLFVCVWLVFASAVNAQNISVSIKPAAVSLLVTGQQEFTATVTNDVLNGGVVWSVSAASGTACTGAACGTVSPTSTPSGTPTAYEAPATAPVGGAVIVTATSVTDPTKTASVTVTVTPAVNNAKMSGDYAFTFTGMRAGGPFVFAGVGRFTADGAGNLTNGEVDVNATQYPGPVVTNQAFTGTYAIGVDNRGVMNWQIQGSGASSGTQTFANLTFAIKADGSVMFNLFDPVISVAEYGSGIMEKADAAAYSTAQIKGDYAFGVSGFDQSSNRAALAGRLTADGAGTFTKVDATLNGSGGSNLTSFTIATYSLSDPSTGRGTIHLAAVVGLMPKTFNLVFYIVNAGKLFAMETDPYAMPTPLLSGVLLHQQMPAGGFSNALLNGSMVVSVAGGSACSGSTQATEVLAGLLTADGNGSISLTDDENCGGTSRSGSNQFGIYRVDADGHSCITVGPLAAAAYLVNSNEAFVLSTDSSVLFGFAEPQAAGSFANSAVAGNYVSFTSTIAPFAGHTFSGEFTADGTIPTGNITGTEDIVDANGPNTDVPFSATYSVSSSPTNGRGTISVASPSGDSVILYVVSPSKFVAISLSDPNPAILTFEQ